MTTPATYISQDIVDILRLGPRDNPEAKDAPPDRSLRKRIGYWRALRHPDDPIPQHCKVLGTAPLRADGGHEGAAAEAFMRLPWYAPAILFVNRYSCGIMLVGIPALECASSAEVQEASHGILLAEVI
jgi:hypothetical protein